MSNRQPHDCLLNSLFRRRSKKTSKLRVTVFLWGIHRWLVNSPHKGPVTRKMFHLMTSSCLMTSCSMVMEVHLKCNVAAKLFIKLIIYQGVWLTPVFVFCLSRTLSPLHVNMSVIIQTRLKIVLNHTNEKILSRVIIQQFLKPLISQHIRIQANSCQDCEVT